MISIFLLTTILVNTIFFFTLLIKNILSNGTNEIYSNILKAENAILAIAFTQYAVTFVMENSNVLDKDSQEFAQQLRYVDWLTTTPLLLYTYWKLAKVQPDLGASKSFNGNFFTLFIADVIMMVCGIFAEIFSDNKTLSYILFILGTIAYGVIVYEIVNIMNYFQSIHHEAKNLGWYFILGWLIYPIGFFMEQNSKYILYSFGDFINKGLYSMSLNSYL